MSIPEWTLVEPVIEDPETDEDDVAYIVEQLEALFGRVIFATLLGSKGYNLALPSSDADLVVVASIYNEALWCATDSPFVGSLHSLSSQRLDYVAYDVSVFAKHVRDSDSFALEPLFQAPHLVLRAEACVWDVLHAARHDLLLRNDTMGAALVRKYYSEAMGRRGVKLADGFAKQVAEARDRGEEPDPGLLKLLRKKLYVQLALFAHINSVISLSSSSSSSSSSSGGLEVFLGDDNPDAVFIREFRRGMHDVEEVRGMLEGMASQTKAWMDQVEARVPKEEWTAFVFRPELDALIDRFVVTARLSVGFKYPSLGYDSDSAVASEVDRLCPYTVPNLDPEVGDVVVVEWGEGRKLVVSQLPPERLLVNPPLEVSALSAALAETGSCDHHGAGTDVHEIGGFVQLVLNHSHPFLSAVLMAASPSALAFVEEVAPGYAELVEGMVTFPRITEGWQALVESVAWVGGDSVGPIFTEVAAFRALGFVTNLERNHKRAFAASGGFYHDAPPYMWDGVEPVLIMGLLLVCARTIEWLGDEVVGAMTAFVAARVCDPDAVRDAGGVVEGVCKAVLKALPSSKKEIKAYVEIHKAGLKPRVADWLLTQRAQSRRASTTIT